MSGEKLTKVLNLKDRLKTLWNSTSKKDKVILAAYLKCRVEFASLNTPQIREVMELLQAYMKQRDGG